MKLRIRHFYILFFITLALTAFCGVLITRVNVNSDMTKYLPDDSRMRKGLAVLQEEFGSTSVNGAGIKVMVRESSDSARDARTAWLEKIPEVSSITSRTDGRDSSYTLYELYVPDNIDQKTLGATIKAAIKEESVVETSQDGATPPVSVLIIAGSLILLILLIMSDSWMSPLLFLLATGLAVIINIGTNAFLPSVSITTNYIVAILQLVLSLDYSIILTNRYRQERQNGLGSKDALNVALPKAAPSILSSALTTVVGLLMLVFMKLKIGMDMGIVLAKGVVCSLVCNFTALPAMILIFDKAIEASGKRQFAIPTDRLASFNTKHKVTLAILFVGIFTAAFIFHDRTVISFSTNGESEIGKIFPTPNTVVMVYDNKDEEAVIPFADSIKTIDGVTAVISYPTLLMRPKTADGLVNEIKSLAGGFGGGEVGGFDENMLTPEIVRIIYYMKNKGGENTKISFPDLAAFIDGYAKTSPLFDSVMDEDMKEKLGMLSSFTIAPAAEEEKVEEHAAPVVEETAPEQPKLPETTEKETDKPVETISKPVVVAPVVPKTAGSISIIKFVNKLAAARGGDENVAILATLVDTVNTRKQMNAAGISGYVGSTNSQTKIVFSFSKSKTMSPLEYVHFLADDLFNRKALASMVNKDQKEGLLARMAYMDYANADAFLPASKLAQMTTGFGVDGVTEQYVISLMSPAPVVPQQPEVVETPVETTGGAVAEVTAPADTAAAAQTPAPVVETPKPQPKPKKKTQEEIKAELFMDMMYSGKEYTAEKMAKNFKTLGENIDPELVGLLYSYYGSVNDYDESWVMTIEELIEYAFNDIVDNEDFSMLMTPEDREKLHSLKDRMEEGTSQLKGDDKSIAVILSTLPDESPETYSAIDRFISESDRNLSEDHYLIGESVMFSEMKNGFNREMLMITLLTVLAIFLIVAITFRSIIVPIILVMTVMTGVYVNVIFSGLGGRTMLYLAYLIVQSILMGATIDYGILFTNYYREKRATLGIEDSVKAAYKGSIHTIMTSGLIMCVAPGVMSLLVDDVAISAIVGCLSIGAFVAVMLILIVVPGLLAAFDKLVTRKSKRWENRKNASSTSESE